MIRQETKRNRLYTKVMNAARQAMDRYKNAHPFCEVCGRNVQEVHHIIPVESECDYAKMLKLATDPNNMQSLCRPCHVSVHVSLRSKKSSTIKEREKERAKHIIEAFSDDNNDRGSEF